MRIPTVKELKEKIKIETPPVPERQPEDHYNKGMLTIKTASEWIEDSMLAPVPKMLFGEFWFEGELCILFADTNLGKSILAVQIGNSISQSQPIPGFTLEAVAQPVIYFDFELTAKQFENRYSQNFTQHYDWHDNFMRVEINPYSFLPEKCTYEDYLLYSLEKIIKETSAEILIIDNLTYLKSETEKATFALPLMKELKGLKSRYNLSILALAHTPKRDLSKPVTRNDLQGSKMLINFCDSSFAIGESHADSRLRYLKQIKARNCEVQYDADNVMVCQIAKPHNFLQFEFLNFAREWEHLREPNDSEKTELENNVRKIMEAEPGITAYAIAKKLCIDESKFRSFQVKIGRLIKKIVS